MKITNIIFLSFLLSLSSLSAQAGKIYRFDDQSGTSTLSKILPPYASQQGYDILDEKSLRLIERVPSQEQSIKAQQEQDKIEQQKQLALREKEEQEKLRQISRIKDQNLIAQYPSTAILIKSRDADLHARQVHINDIKQQSEISKQKLIDFQEKIGQQEFDGEAVSDKQSKHLNMIQDAINHNQLSLQREAEALEQTKQQFESDLIRLEILLGLMAAQEQQD